MKTKREKIIKFVTQLYGVTEDKVVMVGDIFVGVFSDKYKASAGVLSKLENKENIK